jgi:phospholipid transport system substrate-binding protein
MILSVVWLSALGVAASDTPTAFIKQTTDSILQVFEDPQLQGPGSRQARLARLQQIADVAFDWEEIARRALATHWRERTPEERREFSELFREAMRALYLERLEAAAQRRFQENREIPVIHYGKEEVSDQRAVVRTMVETGRQREIPMEYRLRLSEGQWRVYDMVIAGVSLVNNYRAQFQRIIAQSSYQGLVQRLRDRQLGAVVAEPPDATR